MPRHRIGQLALVGLVAGLFSGLFGVGGGVVVVPALILWFGYEEREATGTSLVAIVVTALAAVALQAGYGNVHVDKGLLVGIPAVGGVVAGTWLQQRVPGAVVRLLFSIFLVATAILLVVRA